MHFFVFFFLFYRLVAFFKKNLCGFCRITIMGENEELFRIKYVKTFPFRLTDSSIMKSLRNRCGLFIL